LNAIFFDATILNQLSVLSSWVKKKKYKNREGTKEVKGDREQQAPSLL